MWPIETRKIEYETWEETTFEQTDEESACEEPAVRIDLRLAGAGESPEQHHDWQLDLGTDSLEH